MTATTETPPTPDTMTQDPGSVTFRPEPTYIGNVSPGTVSTYYAQSLQEMHATDVRNGWGAFAGVVNGFSGAQISKSRNDVVAEYLRISSNGKDAPWLLFLDSDMTFPPDLIPRLQAVAQITGAQIIGGLCVMVGGQGVMPTLYQWDQVPGSTGYTRMMLDYPDDTLLEVAATGSACLMIHRDVLLRMREAAGHDYAWFMERVEVVNRHGLVAHHLVSEDIAFCAAARGLGARVVVDTSIKIGHHKHGRVWTADDIDRRTGQGLPPIVAVIPYKGHLDMTRDLVDRILASRVDEVVLINNGDPSDTIVTGDDRVTTICMTGSGIHRMWNTGILHAYDKHGVRVHIALLNNDIIPCPDFLPLLSQAMVEHPEFIVVGGNYDNRESPSPVIRVDDICANRYDGTGGLPGFAFMIRGDFVSGGYRFPETMTWWGGDNDLILTLRHTRTAQATETSYLAGIVQAARVEHRDTTGSGPGAGTARDWNSPEWREVLNADMAALHAKWDPILAIQRVESLLRTRNYDEALTLLSRIPSDINEHLMTLRDLAVQAYTPRVVELGVRSGVSTVAWLAAADDIDGHVWAVDIDPAPQHVRAAERCTFIQGESTDQTIVDEITQHGGVKVDLVFIDTNHDYDLTIHELTAWARHVRPGGWIVLHDTNVETFPHHETQNLPSEQPPFPVHTAITDWLEYSPISNGWAEVETMNNNNGLTILRIDEDPVT